MSHPLLCRRWALYLNLLSTLLRLLLIEYLQAPLISISICNDSSRLMFMHGPQCTPAAYVEKLYATL